MIEKGQVLSLKIRFNNSGTVASNAHPVLVVDVDKERNITIYYKYDIVPSVSFKYKELNKLRNPYGKKGKNNNMKNME